MDANIAEAAKAEMKDVAEPSPESALQLGLGFWASKTLLSVK